MKMAGSRKAPYTRETPDVLDRVFEWAERIACPMDSRSKRMLSEPKEDVLDFVFQHVESFVCQEDAPRQLLQGPNDLERGNSLVERGIHGQATVLQTRRKIKKLGEEGDVIDYVFEHVESFVCNEEIPNHDAAVVHKAVYPNRKTYNSESADIDLLAAEKRFRSADEQEDEIRVFYQP